MKSTVRLSLVLAIVASLLVSAAGLAQVTSYTSGFQLQNLNPTTAATVNIHFIDQDTGAEVATVNDSIPANQSKTYFPLTAVQDNFNGSVVIDSTVEIAAIANVLGNDGDYGASYVGFTGGAPVVNLPLVMKNNYGISTWFNVQNTGLDSANVTITYSPGTCSETATIASGAAVTFTQEDNTCLSDGFVGAATIDAGAGEVVATVMQVTEPTAGLMPNLLAYNGFTAESTNPVMPLVSSGWYGSGTGIQIQNTGVSDTSVTITYTPSDGFPGATCTETQTIAAGQSETFGFPDMPAACYTDAGSVSDAAFVGSAKVTGNTASQTLVAIVNQVTLGTSTAAAYGAFDPNSATDTVSLPLIMDRNYGIFTGFSVANVGTQPTDIECTFSGTTYTVGATGVAPGEAITDVQLNAIANGYVGSAVCTATGGDAKIAAVVNELTQGAPTTMDALLVYEGLNY